MLSRFRKHSYRFFPILSQNFVKNIKRKTTSMAGLSYKIRTIKEEDVPGVVEITKANRFQYPVSGLRSWMTFDPEGILVAVDEAGKVMGVCCAVKNSEKIYFGGIFCVKEEYRHLEIGHKLFAECYVHAKGVNIGCNCSSEMINAYKRRGFGVFEHNWSSLEYETYDLVDPEVLDDNLPEGVEIRPYHDTLFPVVICYDYALMGFDRTEILDLSLHEDDSLTLVAMKGRTCVGYGSIKLGIQGTGRIGPLYVDEPSVAEALIRRLVIGLPQAKGVSIVTVSNNLCANDLVKKLGLSVQDNSLRVYTKERLLCNFNKIYAQFDVDFACF